MSKTHSALASLDEKFARDGRPAIEIPEVHSFKEFLLKCAKVKMPDGSFAPYSFKGRQALELCVDQIDHVLGSYTGEPLPDAEIDICGGAQFGKTVLVLNLMSYLTGVLFKSVGYCLPDDDLVEGIVDTKFRPEVVDQIPWFADMLVIGKALTKSGKAVNRKGAFLVTNGERTGMGYIRGMGKIPTSFSMDVVIEDEKDDIPKKASKFLGGRMTSSNLRLRMSIGTQRIHGDGQNKRFEGGSQFVGVCKCPDCGHAQNLEESWPGIVRVAMDGVPHPSDPALTEEGDFKVPGSGDTAATYSPDAHYYIACTSCGAELDREKVMTFEARKPERVKLRKYSTRISQLTTPALHLIQIVGDWCNNAVKDPESMIAFNCDRLAIPMSTTQALTPQIMTRSRTIDPFSMSLKPREGSVLFGGLDTGDRCFFTARDVASPLDKRVQWAEQMSTEKVRQRIPQLFHLLGLSALGVDIGAERQLARDLCFILNDLTGYDFPKAQDAEKMFIRFNKHLTWDGPNKRWRGLRCFAVEFTLKEGKGIVHKLGVTQDGKMYPVIACNRNETIQRVVNDLLTADEGVIEVLDGKMRTEPVLRLPEKKPGAPAIVDIHEQHLLVGSQKDDEGKFVDGCENHFLLGNAYAALAETVGGTATARPFHYEAVETDRSVQMRSRQTVM